MIFGGGSICMISGICSSCLYEEITGFKKEMDLLPSTQTPPTQRRLPKSLSVAPSSVAKGIFLSCTFFFFSCLFKSTKLFLGVIGINFFLFLMAVNMYHTYSYFKKLHASQM